MFLRSSKIALRYAPAVVAPDGALLLLRPARTFGGMKNARAIAAAFLLAISTAPAFAQDAREIVVRLNPAEVAAISAAIDRSMQAAPFAVPATLWSAISSIQAAIDARDHPPAPARDEVPR